MPTYFLLIKSIKLFHGDARFEVENVIDTSHKGGSDHPLPPTTLISDLYEISREQILISEHKARTKPLSVDVTEKSTQKTQNNCMIFIQCWTNVEDVGPTLYKCYTHVLSLLVLCSA